MAIVTMLSSVAFYIFEKRGNARWLATASYLMMLATTAAIIITTGHLHSPFLVLWMVMSLCAGLFGLVGLAVMTLLDTAYAVYITTAEQTAAGDILTGAIVFLLPLVISFLVWRHQRTNSDGEQAYTALARELSQVANKSEIVINAIADGVIAVDSRGTIQLINPAAQTIMGWGKEDAMELDYRSVFKLYDNKDKPIDEPNDPIQQVLGGAKSVARNDLSLATSTGKKMIISLLVSPVGQAGAGAIIVFRDITGDVAENRQKAEFISTASHEMRTPVAAIEGYIGLALNPHTATIDDKAREFLVKAHESAQHLGHLFQDLLDVSKAEDGRLGNNPVVIDTTAFIRDIVTGLQATAAAKQLALTFAPDTPSSGTTTALHPVYYVNADQSHFREVISNLIENAIKYTKQGSVTVDITGDDAHVIMSVVDTGLGIPKEDISHLFQKFYRVDNSDTREIGGTGLGLYLCRRLVEAMNGRIWVESDYGKGSMFFVELARVNPTDIAVQPAASPAAIAPIVTPVTLAATATPVTPAQVTPPPPTA